MSESLSLGTVGTAARDRTHTLFGQTMGYVAVTTGFFALGAYAGRHLSAGWAIVWFIVAFACLIAMNFTVRRSRALSVALLLAVGATLGLAMAPTLSTTRARTHRRSGKPAAPPRCSSPGSERPVTRPGVTFLASPACASGRSSPSSCSASC